MSGGHVPHLQRRNGVYHLRVRVPDDLKLRFWPKADRPLTGELARGSGPYPSVSQPFGSDTPINFC